MTSEIKVDTISEQTSANGVTIDGLTIKDGNIIGDVALAGTTPTFTIGDGGAEDAALIFDGNAVDFVVGLDDSADEFRIGVGSGLGSDRVFEINSSGVSTFQKAVHFAGSSPTVTIGDGGAEDAKIVFDGNAQDFYIALDDSADDLIIGRGSTVGTSADIQLNADGDIGIATAPNNVDSGRTLHIKGHNSDGANIRLQSTGDTADTDDMVIQKNDTVGFIKLFGGDTFKVFTSGAERLAVDADGVVSITTSGNGDNLSLISTDADENSGPNLRLYRNSANPAVGDNLGQIDFEGRNDNSQDVVYARMMARARDETDGNEDGGIQLDVMKDGSLTGLWKYYSDGTTSEFSINDDSIDMDFRVESNGDVNCFFVNGGNNFVGIGTSTPGTSAGLDKILEIQGADPGLVLRDDTASDVIEMYNSGGSTVFFNGGADGLILKVDGKNSTKGETAPDVSAGGLTLQQGANDTNILTFKSSDVAHGMTAIAETDTYVEMLKNSDGGGALNLTTLSETAVAFRHIACITGSNTAEATSATSAWGVDARKKNGTSVEGLAADDNIASFRHSDEAQVIFKGDGEIFSNQTATVGTYDAYEDAQLIRAYDLSHMKGVIDSKFDKFVQYNKDDLQKARLIGTDDDGNATPFVNITGMSRLHNGAIWQQYEKHQRLASAFYKLAEKTIGKEEADKLLTEEEIQLLN